MIHDPFDCQMLVELVTEWLEGELPQPTRDDLELHVSTCAGCIAYVEQMRSTQAALERLDSIEVVESVDDAARSELLAIFKARRG
jgi:anti-sigma factor RsiW